MDSLFPPMAALAGLTALERPVHRAIADLKAGAPVLVAGEGAAMVTLAADRLGDEQLAWARRLGSPALVISERRARALGLAVDHALALPLDATDNAQSVLALAMLERAAPRRVVAKAPATALAAIELAKLARRLPAIVTIADPPGRVLAGLTTVSVGDVARYRATLVRSLRKAGEARVPLGATQDATFAVFEDAIGATHTAVLVGTPRERVDVPVRVHSACFTGDLFGSLRCDCGAQLQLALARIREAGSGIILYLDQEGRGIGLANKMRAYGLQDGGLDTVDANHRLGFEDDERDYAVAARMLALLGIERIQVLTNNPAKIGGLERHGVVVSGRLPLLTRPHSHNAQYLATKARRSGHELHYPNSIFAHLP